MKEFKIFAIIVILSGILYWGIEPYAHTQLHPHTSEANFNYADEDKELAKHNLEVAKASLQNAQANNNEAQIKTANANVQKAQKALEETDAFWNGIDKIDFKNASVAKGKEIFENAGCTGCHGVEVLGMPAPMDHQAASESFGVVPPDLSTAGKIYDERFLAALIKDPTKALKLTHKFNDEHPFPMPAFFAMGDDINSEIADMVVYLQSISEKFVKEHNGISNERLFADACQRCHNMDYDKKYAFSNKSSLSAYMGSNPPDLSMMIRSKNSDNFLAKFINDPQKMLPGTSMPRVGLTKDSTGQIVDYMQKVGDGKKEQREELGIYIMIYFAILSVLAILWKKRVWKELEE